MILSLSQHTNTPSPSPRKMVIVQLHKAVFVTVWLRTNKGVFGCLGGFGRDKGVFDLSIFLWSQFFPQTIVPSVNFRENFQCRVDTEPRGALHQSRLSNEVLDG